MMEKLAVALESCDIAVLFFQKSTKIVSESFQHYNSVKKVQIVVFLCTSNAQLFEMLNDTHCFKIIIVLL